MINKKYFILNYPLANSLVILAVLFHIWSGGSEFLGIQGYISDFLEQKFPGFGWTGYAAAVIPLLLAFTIEFSFVALLRYVLNSLLMRTLSRASITKTIDEAYAFNLDRYRKEKAKYDAAPEEYGLNEPAPPERPDYQVMMVANRVMFVFACAAFIAIFWVSMTVSKKSIEYDTLVNGPRAHIGLIDSLDAAESQQKAQVYGRMNQELRTARTDFQRDSQAIASRYGGEIAALEEKLTEYGIRERRQNQSYAQSRSIRRRQIKEQEAAMAKELLARSALLAEEETAIRDRYNPSIAQISGEYLSRRNSMIAENDKLTAINEERNAWFSTFLRRYAQLATLGQFMCWVYVILAFFVMGIQKKPRVRPESLESGLLADLGLLLYTAPTRWIHNGVRGWLARVPPLYQMPGVGAVYDIDTLNEIAPLLEQLDKTKSLEEKKKIQRAIKRKVNGYQRQLAESVEERDVEDVENHRNGWSFLRWRRGVDRGGAQRRINGASTPASTSEIDVDHARRTNTESVDPESVESPGDSVATLSTQQGRGVERDDHPGVDPARTTRREPGVEIPHRERRNDVDTHRRNDSGSTQETKGRSTVIRQVEQHTTTKVYDADVKREVELKVVHAGETHREAVEIRVIIDGINVLGKYNKQERDYGWFRTQKSNYEGFLRKGQRDPVTSQLRIQLFEAYMKLIEEVEKDYHEVLTQNKIEAKV